MTTRRSQTTLENSPSPSTPEGPGLPVQAKLAAAWTSFMFLYVYVDILVLFWKPGVIEGILAGTVWGFAIGQTPATIALTLMAIPIFMVVLSMTLPSRANRITNLVVASVQIPYAAFNAVGESWTYFYGLSIGLEVLILSFILRSAGPGPSAPRPPRHGQDVGRGEHLLSCDDAAADDRLACAGRHRGAAHVLDGRHTVEARSRPARRIATLHHLTPSPSPYL